MIKIVWGQPYQRLHRRALSIRSLTKVDVDKFIFLHAQGIKFADAVNQIDAMTQRQGRHLSEKLKLRWPDSHIKYDRLIVDKIIELSCSGLNNAEISRQLKLPARSIDNIVSRESGIRPGRGKSLKNYAGNNNGKYNQTTIKQVLKLSWLGYTMAKISRELNIPPRSVGSIISRETGITEMGRGKTLRDYPWIIELISTRVGKLEGIKHG